MTKPISKTKFYAHPTALVESSRIGARTRVWAFSHVQSEARIGSDCNVGEHCFIENGVKVGSRVTIKNGVCLWKGLRIADGAFIGPYAVFTNDRRPRSPRMKVSAPRYHDEKWLTPVILEKGASVGANATVIGPVRLGRYCLVAAGTVVTRNVKPFELVAGNPCRHLGWVNQRGERVASPPRTA